MLFSKPKYYQSSSEFVTTAHPDRLADMMADSLIDHIIKTDGIAAHAAIEVFITHDTITFGGEATTSVQINDKLLRNIVSKCYHDAGYIPEMRKFWNKTQVALPSNMTIYNKVEQQSPDIALATTNCGENSGYNDCGVFFSSAQAKSPYHMGFPHYIATAIGQALQNLSYSSITNPDDYQYQIGPDIKVVVTCKVKEDGFTPVEVTNVSIAVPHTESLLDAEVSSFHNFIINVAKLQIRDINVPIAKDCKFVVNGTGRFVVMGNISDTSMTGRKISVNHPSAGPVWCNKMIGGGSMHKCPHASDLILNLYARFIANVVVTAGLSSFCVAGCACVIGATELQSIFLHGDKKFEKIKDKVANFFLQENTAPLAIAKTLGFTNPKFSFAEAANNNFFGDPESQPWEHPDYISPYVKRLQALVN